MSNKRLKSEIATEKERNQGIKKGLEVLQRLQEEEMALKRKKERDHGAAAKRIRPGLGQRNKDSVTSILDIH